MIKYTRNLRILGCYGVPLRRESICTMIDFAEKLQRLEVTSFTLDTLFLCLLSRHANTLMELKVDVELLHNMSILRLEDLAKVERLSLNYCGPGGLDPWTLYSFGRRSTNSFQNLSFLHFKLYSCFDSEQGGRMIQAFSTSRFPGLSEVTLTVDNPWEEDIWAEHLIHFLNYHASHFRLQDVSLSLSNQLLNLMLPYIWVQSVNIMAHNGKVPIRLILSPHIQHLTLGPYIGRRGINDLEILDTEDIFSNLHSHILEG
jgi:hypothetical protein